MSAEPCSSQAGINKSLNHNLPLPSLGISKPLTRFALFFPPSLTLVYSHVASQTEAQLPAQQMSITSNYSCPRCMVAGLCLGTNGLQAEQANGAGGRMWAVGHVTTGTGDAASRGGGQLCSLLGSFPQG